MASQERVQWAQLKAGIVAAVAMVIAGVLIFLLTGQSNVFGSDFHLATYMEDSAGMAANDPVRLNGILVGHIGSIKLSGSRDPKRTVADRYGDPGKVSGSDSGRFEIGHQFCQSAGRSSTSTSPKGRIPSMWSRAAKFRRCRRRIFPQIMAQSSALLAQFQTILGRVDGLLAIVENGQGNIGKLIKDDSLYDRAECDRGRAGAAGQGREEQQRNHQPSAVRRSRFTTTSGSRFSAWTTCWRRCSRARARWARPSTIRSFTTRRKPASHRSEDTARRI